VEELELLVIRHVFENRIHFLAFVAHIFLNFSCHHQAMVPILRHIVITDFNASFVAASYSTVFSFPPEQKMY
jgi:hypothetical protein